MAFTKESLVLLTLDTSSAVGEIKSVQLTLATDDETIKKFLKGRERHTVLHDSDYFNPSTISSNQIIKHIRDFYLRTRFG